MRSPLVRCLLLSLPLALPAAEIVHLKNGVRFEIQRHEREGDDVWLYTASGFLHLPVSQIRGIEEVLPAGTAAAAARVPARTAAASKRPVPFVSRNNEPVRRKIDEAAYRHGLPAAIVHAVAQSESNYQQQARSHVGAIGVMQLMPATAADLGANPRDLEENIDAGTRYLRQLLVQYQNHPDQVAMAVAAYNAGPGAVQRYRGIPPYQETRTYVRRVLGKYERMVDEPSAAAPAAAQEAAGMEVRQPVVESIPVVAPTVVTPTVVN